MTFWNEIRSNKVVIADIQILGAAFFFGIGFLGQRAISVDGLGPMTCNAFRFGLSAIMLVLLLPILPAENGPNEKTSDGEDDDDDDVSDQEALEMMISPNHTSSSSKSPPSPTTERTIKLKDREKDTSVILGRLLGVNAAFNFKFAKTSVWFWGMVLGLLNFLGSGFQQVSPYIIFSHHHPVSPTLSVGHL
jgi:hypothetical protein